MLPKATLQGRRRSRMEKKTINKRKEENGKIVIWTTGKTQLFFFFFLNVLIYKIVNVLSIQHWGKFRFKLCLEVWTSSPSPVQMDTSVALLCWVPPWTLPVFLHTHRVQKQIFIFSPEKPARASTTNYGVNSCCAPNHGKQEWHACCLPQGTLPFSDW